MFTTYMNTLICVNTLSDYCCGTPRGFQSVRMVDDPLPVISDGMGFSSGSSLLYCYLF